MKDLDQRLESASRTPRRKLSSDFTARIVADITAHPNGAPRKESLFMHITKRPAFIIALFAVVLLGSGTSYAATSGFTKPFNFKNIFGYQETIDSEGARIIRVQTANCNSTATSNSSASKSDRELTFRVREGASIKAEEAQRWTQGYCENYVYLKDNFNIFEKLAKRDSRNQVASDSNGFQSNLITSDGYLGLPASSKRAISLVSTDAKTNAQNADFYGQLESGSQITDWKKKALKYEDLIGGRYAIVISRLTGSEGLSDADPAVYVYQASKDETFFIKNRNVMDKKIERVVPCSSDTSKYCSIKESTKQTSTPKKPTTNNTPIENTYKKLTTNQETKRAATMIKKAYKDLDATSDWYSGRKAFINKYATPELAKALGRPAPMDTIMCVQNAPGTLGFTSPQRNGDTVTVIVTGQFEAESKMQLAEVSYSIPLQKITSIDCIVSMP